MYDEKAGCKVKEKPHNFQKDLCVNFLKLFKKLQRSEHPQPTGMRHVCIPPATTTDFNKKSRNNIFYILVVSGECHSTLMKPSSNLPDTELILCWDILNYIICFLPDHT